MRRELILLAALVFPAFAHHSLDAEFDRGKPVTVSGTVTKVDWLNPHIWIYVDVKETDGKVTKWQFEGSAPNALRRNGWTRTSLKEGDKVTVAGIKAKVEAGLSATTGHANSVTLADGKRMFSGQGDGK